MGYDLFKEIIPSLNRKTGNLYDEDSSDTAGYPAYILNKYFAYNPETLFFAEYLNSVPNLSPKMHYDFLYYGVDKTSNRYGKWPKKDAEKEEYVEAVCQYMTCSSKKAREFLKFLTPEDLKDIMKETGRL